MRDTNKGVTASSFEGLLDSFAELVASKLRDGEERSLSSKQWVVSSSLTRDATDSEMRFLPH